MRVELAWQRNMVLPHVAGFTPHGSGYLYASGKEICAIDPRGRSARALTTADKVCGIASDGEFIYLHYDTDRAQPEDYAWFSPRGRPEPMGELYYEGIPMPVTGRIVFGPFESLIEDSVRPKRLWGRNISRLQ